jgi:hypothetical protein
VADVDIPDTMTRAQLEARRGPLANGAGAADLVSHHDPTPAKRTPAQVEAFRQANERRHAEKLARQAANGKPQVARKANHPTPAVSEPPGATQPVADWPTVLGRLAAAGLEVRAVQLVDGWLLMRSS